MRALIVNLNLAVDKTAVIPSFESGKVFRFPETITLPGGKGVNVARALRVLGVTAPLTGFVSGHSGRWIEEALAEEGFELFPVRHAGGESRVCFTVVDGRGRATDLNEDGPPVPAAAQRVFLREFSARAEGVKVAAVCGRMPRGLKKGFYTSLVRLAAARGCFTIFDTSGPPLAEAISAGAGGVKINRAEFEELAGERFSPASLRLFFKSRAPRGLKTAIVTDGPSHTCAVSAFGLWRVSPPRLAGVKSPTGAGDSFMAGFLYGFLGGWDFERSLKLGCGAAASDCLSLGAGLIKGRQALAYAEKARVEKIG